MYLGGGGKVSDFWLWQDSNQALSSTQLFSSLSLLLQIFIIPLHFSEMALKSLCSLLVNV